MIINTLIAATPPRFEQIGLEISVLLLLLNS